MKDRDPRELPMATEMPVVTSVTLNALRALRDGAERGGRFWYRLGENFVEKNPAQVPAFQALLRTSPSIEEVPAKPNVTSAACLYTWKLLDMQATTDGVQLPEFGETIDPSQELQGFWDQAEGIEERVLELAHEDLVRSNSVLGEIVNDIAEGAPDAYLRAITEEQVKRGAVYVYFGLRSLILGAS